MKKVFIVLIIAFSLAACNNSSDSTESTEPTDTETTDSADSADIADSAAMMMDPANIIKIQDTLNRRPHQ